MIKALVPTGRRGKAGAVQRAESPDQAAAVAGELLGKTVDDHVTREVYVEQVVDIARELYCAFLFDDDGPRILVSADGGVDIEVAAREGGALISRPIDPLRGITPWLAIDLWRQAGLRGRPLRALGEVTARLYAGFVAADAELLEINPLAIDAAGNLVLVGAIMAIDAAALTRQGQWRNKEARLHPVVAPSPRETRVARIDADVPGPEARYVELDGTIGLLVGGGGAGLYQQDRLRAWGGTAANHSVTPPTGSDTRKLRAVIEAILDHPHVRGLLVGFNFAQMARADVRVSTLLDVLDSRGLDTGRFPIVIRMFGAGEAEARGRAAGRPGIHYLPRDASLEDAVRLIVALTKDHEGRAAG